MIDNKSDILPEEKKGSVELAKKAGFCFGVERAIKIVNDEIAKGGRVMTLGPIIHNEIVIKELEEKNVFILKDDEIADRDDLEGVTVIIRSHGVKKEIYDLLLEKGCKISDATCPFVSKIHKTVNEYSRAGYGILIIGEKTHPEVQGIIGWCEGNVTIINSKKDAIDYKPSKPDRKVCLVSQTTFNLKKFQVLVEIISKKGYDIIAVNTICDATAKRQNEASELATRSDTMFVIGGKSSSNSTKLYEICKEKCKNTYFIQSKEDLEERMFAASVNIGITAGASTPNNIIQEVLESCQKKKTLENY